MKTKMLILLFAFSLSTISMTEAPKTNIDDETVKPCCSFSGNFKYNSKGWEFGGKFTITFGLAGDNQGGGDSNIDWADIVFGPMGNSTIPANYLEINPPKEYIGKEIEIYDSKIDVTDMSCGNELLGFLNLKLQPGKIKLTEKTKIKIVNLPADAEAYPTKPVKKSIKISRQ